MAAFPAPHAPRVLVLIPAAGAAARMRGGDKLMEPVDGQPQLCRVVRAALDTGCRVAVTLRPGDEPRRAALAGLEPILIEVPDASEGMAASLRRGAAACPPGHGLMVLPADMPELGSSDLARVVAAARTNPDSIVRATSQDGRPGQPVLFPPRLVPRFAGLSGDSGARALLQGEDVLAVPLPDMRALTDLDTPEDWAAWRAGRGHGATEGSGRT